MSEIRNEEELKEEIRNEVDSILDSEDCEIDIIEPEEAKDNKKLGGFEVGIIGAAVVGVVTIGYGIYKGGKFVVTKAKTKLDDVKEKNLQRKEKESKKTNDIPEDEPVVEETKTEEVKTEEEVKEVKEEN